MFWVGSGLDDFLKVEDENYKNSDSEETRKALTEFITTFYSMNEVKKDPNYLLDTDTDDSEEETDSDEMPELEEARQM